VILRPESTDTSRVGR